MAVEGNSISSDFYTSLGSFDNHLMTVEPLASSGAVHGSAAATSSSWGTIIGRAGIVDAYWRDGANNILVVNETLNTVASGASVETITGQIEAYISGRLALHPWRIIFWLTTPYGGGPGYATFNATIDAVDAWVVANADRLGIERVVDPRIVPTFDHDGTSAAAFAAFASHWQETAPPYVHPLDPPKLAVAALIVAAMETMQA